VRDVIVIGAGGGGPVIAKELAERGLDVLILEAGARNANPEEEWRHLENDANNPVDGYFRFGPSDRSKPAWLRELPQNSFLWQVSGVGGTTTSRIMAEPAEAMLLIVMNSAGYNREITTPRPEPLWTSAPQCLKSRRLWNIAAVVVCWCRSARRRIRGSRS